MLEKRKDSLLLSLAEKSGLLILGGNCHEVMLVSTFDQTQNTSANWAEQKKICRIMGKDQKLGVIHTGKKFQTGITV